MESKIFSAFLLVLVAPMGLVVVAQESVCSPYKSMEFLRDDNDCNAFYVCLNREILAKIECPPGLAFNQEFKVCDAPDNVPGCNGTVQHPDCSGRFNQQFRKESEDECALYYSCNENGQRSTRQCPPGQVFSNLVRTCVDVQSGNNDCLSQICLDNGQNGVFTLREEFNCPKYTAYTCNAGRLFSAVEANCGVDQVYSIAAQRCVGVCDSLNDCDGSLSDVWRVPGANSCTRYRTCVNGFIADLECQQPNQVFSILNKTCVDIGHAFDDCQGRRTEDARCEYETRFMHGRYCRVFYECVNGFKVRKVCPADTIFDGFTCKYEDGVRDCNEIVDSTSDIRQYTDECVKFANDPTRDPDVQMTLYQRDVNDCSVFYQCNHEKAYRINCPAGSLFNYARVTNATLGRCVDSNSEPEFMVDPCI